MSTMLEGGGSRSRDGSLMARLYQSLKADILSGAFDMGQLLNEGQLSTRYGASRGVVRQALTSLQRDGLVEVIPRVGYLTSRLTPQDVEDIFELRLLIEAETAQKAAARISGERLSRLKQLCSSYRPGERQSYRRHLDENLEFHHIIADAAGNRRMASVLVQAMEQMVRLLILRLDMSTGNDVVEEHLELAAALEDRDGDTARDLMVRHLLVAQQATTESIKRLTASRHI